MDRADAEARTLRRNTSAPAMAPMPEMRPGSNPIIRGATPHAAQLEPSLRGAGGWDGFASRALSETGLLSGLDNLRRQAVELEDQVHGSGRAHEKANRSSEHPKENLVASSKRYEDELRAVENRLSKLELEFTGFAMLPTASAFSRQDTGAVNQHAEAGVTNSMFVRLRNELGLSVQELNDQLGTRLREMRTWQDDLESEVRTLTSEALHTCSRLADDSMAVSEATQLKVKGLSESTDTARRQMEAELVSLRQEFSEGLRKACSDAMTESEAIRPRRPPEPLELPAASREVVDIAARRLTEELGTQIWRIGEAVRRVVQVHLSQQHFGKASLLSQGMRGPRPPSAAKGAPTAKRVHQTAAPYAPRGPRGRVKESIVGGHDAIVELYEELQHLEEGALACIQRERSRSASRRSVSAGSRSPRVRGRRSSS